MAKMKLWVGLRDGTLPFYSLPDYYNGVIHADFFRTKREARRCYEDVREATLTFNQKQPKAKRRL